MAFIRYKPRGDKWYAYEVSNVWNKEKKKYIQHSIYKGVASEKGGEITKPRRSANPKREKSIVDFGDGFIIKEMLQSTGIGKIIDDNFTDADTIKTLIAYQMTIGSAMYNCDDWAQGNIISILFSKTNLTSQHISKLIKSLGDEGLQRKFFKSYVESFFKDKHGILIDSTAMPSAINSSLSSWGYSSEGIKEVVNCLMLVDKTSKMPIYFRAIAGDIPDISTMKITVDEITKLGLKMDQAIFDAGYFSESNIKYLCEKKIDFISRMPKSRKIFKELIGQTTAIEKLDNATVYGKRAVFIESKKMEMYGYEIYAHIIFDPGKKVNDVNMLLLERESNPGEEKDYQSLIDKCGYFVLVSRAEIAKDEIMPSYYARQGIEQVFGFAKNNMSLLPLRVHSNQSITGYLLLVFLSIGLYVQIRAKLQGKWTVEQAFCITRCHKAKVYEKELIPLEPRKKDKDIYTALGITVPISCGI